MQHYGFRLRPEAGKDAATTEHEASSRIVPIRRPGETQQRAFFSYRLTRLFA